MIYYYVNAISGTDELDAGAQDNPFKTLDYCITQIHSRNIQKLNIEYKEQVLSLLNNPVEILNEEVEEERQKYLKRDITRAYTDDIIVYLGDGEYEITNTNLYLGESSKSLTIIGNGMKTTINNKYSTANSTYGTKGFTITFARLQWDNKFVTSLINPHLFNCEIHYKNILFKNTPNTGLGFFSGCSSAFYMNNCINITNCDYFLRSDGLINGTKAGNVTNSYGYFTVYGGIDYIFWENTKIITGDLQLDKNYKIIDPSVDTSKIGLYAGEYTWFEQNCLIKMNNKYYSILEEFWNTETKTFNEVGSKDFEKSFDLRDLTKEVTYGDDIFIPLEKFDNFNIVFKDESIKKLNINGYKIENKTVITNPVDVRMVENFNSVTINGNNVKCLIKFDEEEQYYTYNFEKNTFENEEIDNIDTKGIDISKIKDIDFNNIKEEKDLKNVTFAFYLEQDSIVNNIIIDYLEIGEFSQKTSTETKLKVGYKKISIQPTFNANLLKINVL